MEKLYTVSKNKSAADWLKSSTPYCQIKTNEKSMENH